MKAFLWDGSSREDCRSEFNQEGFLLLRQFIDKLTVLAARDNYFRRFDPIFLAEGTNPVDGWFSGHWPKELPSHGIKGHPAFAFCRSKILQELVDLPQFLNFAEIILGGTATRLKRTPIRHFVQDRPNASRAHIDGTYLDATNHPFLTFWIPLGDCSVKEGGILYLEQSHQIDVNEIRRNVYSDRENDPRPITHDLKLLSDFTGRRWYYTDFQAGDVVVHSHDIIHASTNAMTRKMRLSVDVRFDKHGKVPDKRWQNYWSADDGY